MFTPLLQFSSKKMRVDNSYFRILKELNKRKKKKGEWGKKAGRQVNAQQENS